MDSKDLESAEPGSGRPWRRWLLRALIVLAVLEVLYLALANAFLRTSVGDRVINRQPEKFQISWGSARTFWPGLIHLSEVHFKNQDRRLRWELELDRVTLVCSVPAFVLKRFTAHRIAGHGLEFRLLRRPEPGETPPAPGVVPEILFPGPLEQPTGGGRTPERWPWTLLLSGIDVDGVREVWIEDQRFVGDGRVNGGMRLKIHGALEIAPSTLELVDGRLTRGDEVVAEQAHLVVEARSERFAPRENPGPAVLGFMTGRVRFESPRTGFGFLGHYFQKAPWVDVGGTGDVRVDVAVDHGRLSPGSLVTVESKDLTVDALGVRAIGLGRIRAEVLASGGDGADGVETRLAADLDDFEIVVGGEDGPPLARGSGLALVAQGGKADLSDGFGDLAVELAIPRSEIPDVRVFNTFLPSASDLRFQSGQGDFQGRLALDSAKNSGKGEFEVHGDGVGLKFQDTVVVGDVRATARLRGADLAGRRYDISGSQVILERFLLADAEGATEEAGWWGEIELREGEIRTREETVIDASVAARIRDTGPLAAYLAERVHVLRWFQDLLTIEDVTAEGRLRTDAETLAVHEVRIAGGEKLEILATALHLTRGRRDGLYFFKLGPLSAGVEIDGQERDWKLTNSRRWYEQRAAELRAAVPPPTN